MEKNKKEPVRFYGVRLSWYLIAYALMTVTGIFISCIGESDGGGMTELFLIFLGLIFLIFGGGAAVISVLTTLAVIFFFKDKKKIIPNVFFTLLSAAYIISIILSAYSVRHLSFSIPG